MNYLVRVSCPDLKGTREYHMENIESLFVEEGFMWFIKKDETEQAIRADLIISITLE